MSSSSKIKYEYPSNIESAASLLDSVIPDWYKRIDINILDMAKGRYCILGQLFPLTHLDDSNGVPNAYMKGVYELFGPDASWSGNDKIFGSAASTIVWKGEIAYRKTFGAPVEPPIVYVYPSTIAEAAKTLDILYPLWYEESKIDLTRHVQAHGDWCILGQLFNKMAANQQNAAHGTTLNGYQYGMKKWFGGINNRTFDNVFGSGASKDEWAKEIIFRRESAKQHALIGHITSVTPLKHWTMHHNTVLPPRTDFSDNTISVNIQTVLKAPKGYADTLQAVHVLIHSGFFADAKTMLQDLVNKL